MPQATTPLASAEPDWQVQGYAAAEALSPMRAFGFDAILGANASLFRRTCTRLRRVGIPAFLDNRGERTLEAQFGTIMNAIILLIESLGVIVILGGIVMAGIGYVRAPRNLDSYQQLRATMGRAILLGLELMVAADIINTVAVEPSFDSVLLLAAIVIIRTFLSLSLEVEISGRWPWAAEGPGHSVHRGENAYSAEEAPAADGRSEAAKPRDGRDKKRGPVKT